MRCLRAEISHHDSVSRFRQMGVDVFLDYGRFSSPSTVEVDGSCKMAWQKASVRQDVDVNIDMLPVHV